VIRSLTIDEDFRLADWLGFHVEKQPEKGSITRYDYQVAIGQAVARAPGERMADIALQLYDSTFDTNELHVYRGPAFKPESRHDLISKRFDLVVGVFADWVVKRDRAILAEKTPAQARMKMSMFTTADADFHGHMWWATQWSSTLVTTCTNLPGARCGDYLRIAHLCE
jgi:hypothetical protein